MGGWWFLCLVLAATFTVIFAIEDNKSTIPNSIDELINEIPPNIDFGVFSNPSTAEYLKLSPIPQYQQAFQYIIMEKHLFSTTDEALTAVLHDNIALITDGPYVEFLASRKGPYNPDCTLMTIGDGNFFPAGYGLGLPKNSPYTDDFSLAILELREKGEIEDLITEYFDIRRTCTSEIAITSASISMDTEQIELKRFGGIFIFLGIAIIISLIVLLVERTVKHRKGIKTKIVERFYIQHQLEESATLQDFEEASRASTEL